MLDRWIEIYQRRVVKPLIYVSWAALLFTVAMVVTDVSGRFFFNQPLPASVEMTELLMPWVVWPCMAFTLFAGGHVRVSLVTMRMPWKVRLGCEVFAFLIGAAFFAAVFYPSWMRFWDSWIAREFMLAAISLPWYVGKFIYPIGVVLFCLQFLIHLRNAFRGRLAPTGLAKI